MKASGIFGLVVVGFVGLFGLTWLVQGNDFFLYKTFAPKYADVQREVFEQTAPTTRAWPKIFVGCRRSMSTLTPTTKPESAR